MSKTSKGLGIAGSVTCIVFSTIIVLIAILTATVFLAVGATGLGALAIAMLLILLAVEIALPVTILILICGKNVTKGKILAAGIIAIILASLGLIWLLVNFSILGLLNLVWIGLLFASGIMFCIERKNA